MELFKIFGSVAIDNNDANKTLDDTTDKAKSTSGVLSKMGGAAVKVGKTVAVGLAAGGAAVTALATKAIQSYADYEQLAGGVETLFGSKYKTVEEYAKGVGLSMKEASATFEDYQKRSEKVLDNAKNAYKTAGLSANEYMETVTSFSASLNASLGENAWQSANYADMAIRDMSDNANKMGTSMESLQFAYQGFAKQNYTMLDNLKLGYGGTKEEMERLLRDAEELEGLKVGSLDVSNFADVVEAINIVQTELGITGTTAKEASQTISGSINAMKGSWQNLITAFVSSDFSLEDEINNFVNSVSTVADNVLPKIAPALDGIVQLIEQLAPKIIAAIPSLMSTIMPVIVNASVSLVNALVSTLPNLVSAILGYLPDVINAFVSIFNTIIDELPVLMDRIIEGLTLAIPALIDGVVSMVVAICEELPNIIEVLITYLPLIIEKIVNALMDNLPILIEAVITMANEIIDYMPIIIETLIGVILQNLPVLLAGLGQLVMGIIQAIPQLLSSLWKAITTLVSNFVTGLFDKIKQWILKLFPKSGESIIKVLGVIKDAIKTWINNVKQIFSVVVEIVAVPFKLAWNAIEFVWNNVVAYFKMIWENIKAVFSVVDSVLSGDFKGAWEGIKSIWGNVVNYFKTIVNNIKKAFSNVFEILSSPFKKAKEAIGNIVDNIKGFFSNLKLKFPSIKLPHFSIKPAGWKISDLLQGSIPKLGIDWYAKGGIFDRPTIFPTASGLKGVGEAGAEAVTPISKLQDYVQVAVDNSNTALEYKLDTLVDILLKYLPAMQNRQMVLDTGVLVGEITTKMDRSLGDLSNKRVRGR